MAGLGTGPRSRAQPSWQCCAGQPRAFISQLGPVVRTRCPSLLCKQWDVPCPPAAGLSGLGKPLLYTTTCPQPCSRSLSSILGKSNLKFAGMPITLTISTSSLNLMASDCKQVRVRRGWVGFGQAGILMYLSPGLAGAGDAHSLPREYLDGLCDECPHPHSPWG